MADYATRQDVQEIVDVAINKLTSEISDMLALLVQHMDERFEKLEIRMDRIEASHEKHLITTARHTQQISDLQDEAVLSRRNNFEKQFDKN